MKLCNLIFCFCLLLASCSDVKIANADNEVKLLESNQLLLADSDAMSAEDVGRVNAQLRTFTIGKSINGFVSHTIVRDDILDKDFVSVVGYTEEGNSVAYRQEIKVVARDNGSIITFVKSGRGETCAGVNCSHCSFAGGGGCDCSAAIDPVKPSGCTHTITKE